MEEVFTHRPIREETEGVVEEAMRGVHLREVLGQLDTMAVKGKMAGLRAVAEEEVVVWEELEQTEMREMVD
jgi:hypothetical protein